ncbi:MAG: PilW family protein, partial [Desulfobulbales bacterium]
TIRAAMDMMSREFRMAGYDPSYSGSYGITNATVNQFSFTADMCEDGGSPANCAAPTPLEIYQYQLYVPGDADANDTFSLQRTAAGNAVAENIERIEFVYLFDTLPPSTSPPPIQYPDIIGVVVTLLARADEPDYNYTNTETYTTATGTIWPAANDNFRRRLLIKTIDLRNMGLL